MPGTLRRPGTPTAPPVAKPAPAAPLPKAPKPPPIPIPKLVKTQTPPVAPVEPERSPAHVDLGSELRADLGGDHSVPKRRTTAPRIEARPSTPPPRMPTADDEPEIEAVVEIEAEPPPEPAAAAEDDSGEVEMTIEAGEPDEPTQDNARSIVLDDDDDDSPEITVSGGEERPGTGSDTVVVSGTIKIPADKPRAASRPKRE